MIRMLLSIVFIFTFALTLNAQEKIEEIPRNSEQFQAYTDGFTLFKSNRNHGAKRIFDSLAKSGCVLGYIGLGHMSLYDAEQVRSMPEKQKHFSLAQHYFEAAMERNPQGAQLRATLLGHGKSLIRTGKELDETEAKILLETLINMSTTGPNDQPSARKIRDVFDAHLELGNKEKALKALKEAIKADPKFGPGMEARFTEFLKK